MERAVLLTIKQQFANRILDGSQNIEHRTRPPRISQPTRTIMYVSGIRELVGEFIMEPVSGKADALGHPLPVRSPVRYAEAKPWKWVRERIAGIRPPARSFRYLDPGNVQDAMLLEMSRSWLAEGN
jgi:hypothetical protein